MLNFIVAVSCAASASCPLGSMTVHKQMQAVSASACRAVVAQAIKSYKYEPKLFNYSCTLTK